MIDSDSALASSGERAAAYSRRPIMRARSAHCVNELHNSIDLIDYVTGYVVY